MFGYTGKSLEIDLSSRTFIVHETSQELCANFLGGRGFGVSLLEKVINNDPYSGQMPIIFAAGPLTASNAPSSGRLSVVSRSPLTGTVLDCSVGGRFASFLKKAGFDLSVIKGSAAQWTAIIIDDNEVKIIDASRWIGFNSPDLRKEIDNSFSIASIGISGERLVRFASIVFDGHYLAGRGGLGAVMGSKRLKFIALRGSGNVSTKDPAMLGDARQEIMRLLRASPAVFGEFGLSNYGTGALVDLIHARRLEPTDNFRGTFYEDSSKYAAYTIAKSYKTRKTGCMGCPVLCKKKGLSGDVIPEYETLSHFGALNKCSDLSAIIEANRICNEYGIDTISAASTIACHSEINCINQTPQDMVDLLLKTAKREGPLGDALAEGSFRYASSKGKPELSMSVKHLELPAYDPRGAYGMALSYAVSSRGGCHLRAYPISHEILRKPVATDRFSFEGKARIIKIAEDMNAVVDSLTACKFMFFAASLEEYAKALTAVTGMEFNVQSLLSIGDRICRLERAMNNSLGFCSDADDLPRRFFSEEGSSTENLRIMPINRADFLAARGRYYKTRGASPEGRIL